MQSLAWMIDRHNFRVTIDGHTRQVPVEKTGDYTAWELSADRANAVRRSLVRYAVDEGNIERVTGFASTQPLTGEKPDAEVNDRITLSLTFAAKAPKNPPAKVNDSSPAAKHSNPPNLSDQKSPP
jgi:chemotaxis protein MotB